MHRIRVMKQGDVQEKDAESVDGKQIAELKTAGTKEEMRSSARECVD